MEFLSCSKICLSEFAIICVRLRRRRREMMIIMRMVDFEETIFAEE